MTRPKPARWLPVMWQATYRRQTVWVEQEYSKHPRWGWHVSGAAGDGDGRARTKDKAQAAALACVDSLLGELR